MWHPRPVAAVVFRVLVLYLYLRETPLFLAKAETLNDPDFTLQSPLFLEDDSGTNETLNVLQNIKYYVDATPGVHQNSIQSLRTRGYRPISVSVYGTPPNERYAAVWTQQADPPWTTIAGASGAGYQAWADEAAGRGFVPTQISATGSGSNVVYAGVMERICATPWKQRWVMNLADFQNENNGAGASGQILQSFRQFGDPTDPRFCAIWHGNRAPDKWIWYNPLQQSDFNQIYAGQISKPYWRLAMASVSDGKQIVPLFTDSEVGRWAFANDLTSTQLAQQDAISRSAGMSLTSIQGAGPGSGTGTRFAATWANVSKIVVRRFTAVGSTQFPGAVAELDSIMEAFMRKTGVRRAQVAIGKAGAIKIERAYSWIEPNRLILGRPTAVNDRFLLASVSKLFCAAAIRSLLDAGRLTDAAKPFRIPGQPWDHPFFPVVDPRIKQITVQQLLEHQGGWDRDGPNGDIIYQMRMIARAMNGGVSPPSINDFISYLRGIRLDFSPGARTVYSNVGYIVLSKVVEHITGQAYFDYLRNAVLSGFDVTQWPTSSVAHATDPFLQECTGIGLSVLQPNSDTLVASQYGGDGLYRETAVGSGSLAASASTIVRFIATHGEWPV